MATTGPGCLYVVNIAPGDALNMRARPSASSRVVDRLVPGQHGILHLDRACGPRSLPWGQRWCKISHFSGDRTTSGYVKARFVRDSECP
jgi:Bacterial SH3 domain